MELELAAGATILYFLFKKKKSVATSEAPAVEAPPAAVAPEVPVNEPLGPQVAIDYVPKVDPRCNVNPLMRPADCPAPVVVGPRNMTPVPIMIGVNAQCFAPLDVIQKF